MYYFKSILVSILLLVSTFGYSQNEYKIYVNGNCGMCQDIIETSALSVDGIEKADWDSETKQLIVQAVKEIDVEQLHIAVSNSGYDTELYKAPDDVYDSLYFCCKYRDNDHTDKEVEKEENNPFHIDHDGHSDYIHGMIYEKEESNDPRPLVGANVYWQGTQNGTFTNDEGFFELDKIEDNTKLIISYIGFASDTIDVQDMSSIAITMKVENILNDVTIVHRKKSTEVSFLDPIKTSNIDKEELFKAACCSLSESFETTPAVDVSFTDAITGARKIEMLGLAGPNVEVMRENMPYVRGIASVSGFEMIPGSWIEGMQLNTGAGSVVNGPESITGQINVELKKPENDDKFFLNLYTNQAERLEANVITAHKLDNKWSTSVMLHGNHIKKANDRNGDGFYDTPIGSRVYALNRWKYRGSDGFVFQAGAKGSFVNTKSGTIESDKWSGNINNQRLEGWAKVGKVFNSHPGRSIGLQISLSNQDQNSVFGQKNYDAVQTTYYANLIYADKLGKGNIKAGASFILDRINETIAINQYNRREVMPGIFTEYNLDVNDKLSILAGLRVDHHNLFSLSLTPRLHLKYNPNESTSFRISGGRGQRTASIFAENIGMFASNRTLVLESNSDNTPYGLNQEIAWNIGTSFTKELMFYNRSLLFSMDYFYTTFDQQVVVDYDHTISSVFFYNLDGKSISHSFQFQLDYELIEDMDIRVAYRYNDVKSQYLQGYREKTLVPNHRAFANIGYGLGRGWLWDGTLSWTGQQRLPDTFNSPVEFKLKERSPSFFVFNTQISKEVNDWTFYVGAENLFNYKQDNPIINVDRPNALYFDASMIWGPVMGRNIYTGLRYRFR